MKSTLDGQVLRRVNGALTWGAIDLADTYAVTGVLPYANLAGLAGTTILGRSAQSYIEISLVPLTPPDSVVPCLLQDFDLRQLPKLHWRRPQWQVAREAIAQLDGELVLLDELTSDVVPCGHCARSARDEYAELIGGVDRELAKLIIGDTGMRPARG